MKIAFYPAQSGKTWTGDALETGPLGGSETAVIYTARELAKRGHEVLVFTRGEPGIYDDVVYAPFEDAKGILYTLPLDALVMSRDPLPFLWPRRASVSAMWLHDVPQSQLPEADFYACVSFWQAQLYAANNVFPLDKAIVTPNGIDPALFTRQADIKTFQKSDKVKLVWTSNPERGIWHAAAVLRRVQEVYPNAELHIFGRNDVYGWNTGYEHSFYPDDMTDVILHEPLNKAELAYYLSEMDLWVYPTWWPETYCIAAVEAQAAGVPVVASAYCALNETAQAGSLIPGMVAQPEHIDLMAKEVIRLLQSPDERSQMQKTGLAYARTQTWAHSAEIWERAIQHKMGLTV